MSLENNIHRYMYKYLEVNRILINFSLLSLTLNVPLQIGKWPPRTAFLNIFLPQHPFRFAGSPAPLPLANTWLL